ncbi:MAG: glutamate racemase [Microscillaceae bacterium]|nr:glutamate racemase [Microscillaceae bacterium]
MPLWRTFSKRNHRRARRITQFLLDKDCKLVVLACNTATSAAIQDLRAHFKKPFVGMEPAIKPAARLTQTGKVGVIATKGTLESERFHNIKTQHAQGVEVWMQIGFGLVENIEAGQAHTPETEALLRQYLAPMLAAPIDQLVLGCTHYPFLAPLLEKITEGRVHLINPAIAVARQVRRLLVSAKDLQRCPQIPEYQFYTTGEVDIFAHQWSYLFPELPLPGFVCLFPDFKPGLLPRSQRWPLPL